jgi:hypothetical protein
MRLKDISHRQLTDYDRFQRILGSILCINAINTYDGNFFLQSYWVGILYSSKYMHNTIRTPNAG